MDKPVSDKIDSMLASVQSEVDDPDLSFKLRTARQLLMVYDERLQKYSEELQYDDLDADMLENLRQLGYLEDGK